MKIKFDFSKDEISKDDVSRVLDFLNEAISNLPKDNDCHIGSMTIYLNLYNNENNISYLIHNGRELNMLIRRVPFKKSNKYKTCAKSFSGDSPIVIYWDHGERV